MRALRAAATVAVVAAVAGLGLAAGAEPQHVEPTFAYLGAPTMPFVPRGSFVTSSWFCPGVPSGGDDRSGSGGDDRSGSAGGGSVILTNPTDAPIEGSVTIYTSAPDAAPASRAVTIPARTNTSVDMTELQPTGSYLSALVEIDGGGGFVEQLALHPAGNAVSPCANATSSNWYFAHGFTVDGSTEQLVLTNPYPDAAIVDVGLATAQGVRSPGTLQGLVVPAQSVQTVDLAEFARDEPTIATRVEATRGRIVAGRSQHFAGGDRRGYSMALGAPSLSGQYYFAEGETGPDIDETYSVYNGSDQDVTVDVVFLGVGVASEFLNDTQLEVPAGEVVELSTADVANLPDGRHGAVFSTFSEGSIVVERVLTRPAGQSIATTVVMGSPPGLASQRWSSAVGTDVAVEDVIVVLNVDAVETTVSVSTLGPGGFVPVPGLEAVPLAAGGVTSIGIEDATALGKPFIVESAQRLFVERLLPRRADLRGRSASFLLAG
jgi:hypothetical protein